MSAPTPLGKRVPGQRPAAGPALARRPLRRWRSVDLTTAALLGVAFGVVFWGWDVLYGFLTPLWVGFQPAAGLAAGVWLLPAVVGALVVRRPGAALFAEVVAATVETLLPGGNQWGAGVLVSGALQGLGVELAVALFAWRRFGAAVAVLGGVLAAALEVAAYEWWVYVPDYTWAWKLAYLGLFAVSGALVAGLGGWALVRALARAGALRSFPAAFEEDLLRQNLAAAGV
ncbi:ECF transporter S component, partial [Kineococcus glutinatus]|uniref:ECF transporter S component n=1 Tax=Kineococcus glutinatus TaxID=1070872 RepID=UPI0031EE4F76